MQEWLEVDKSLLMDALDLVTVAVARHSRNWLV